MVSQTSKSHVSKNAAAGKRFGIVVSRYHEEITQALLDGALQTLKNAGAKDHDITAFWVPGAFEIPLAAHAVAQHREVDAILCLGAIVKGDTPHNEYIASEVARGISLLTHTSNIPVLFGVLTTDNLEQAHERAGGAKGNKGAEAASAALEMLVTLEQIKSGSTKGSKSVGFGNA